MSSSTSNAAAATAAVLGILNDEVSRAMGCQCGPKQSAIVDQLALEKITTVGRRARIQNATRSKGIRFGRLAQRIDCRLLDVCIMVREEGAEMTSMYMYNHETDTYIYAYWSNLLSATNDNQCQETAKHKDANARGDKEPDILHVLGIAAHKLHQLVPAIVVLQTALAAHECRKAGLALVRRKHNVHHALRLRDQKRWQRWRRHRENKIRRRTGKLITAPNTISKH